jgi:hypothetical protein
MTLPHRGQDEYLKYRWEFMRRNEDYQREWEELYTLIEKKKLRSTEKFKNTDIPERNTFCEKWNIYKAVNPNLSYDDLRFQNHSKVVSPFQFEERESYHHNWYVSPLDDVPVRQLDEKDFHAALEGDSLQQWAEINSRIIDTSRLPVEINLHYSTAKLVERLKEIITFWKSTLGSDPETEYSKRRSKYQKKLHYGNFDEYLVVYDLRKEGTSWSKIQKAMDLNSIQTARDYYKAAKKLVSTGLSP